MLNHTDKYSQLRFAFFGTSRTYGALLEHRETQSFPSIISPNNSLNLGIVAGTCQYPAKCAYSMLHPHEYNDAFDVIVIEYEYDDFFILHLMKRLRMRYPKARIIFLEMLKLAYYKNSKENKYIKQWLEDKAFPMPPSDQHFGHPLKDGLLENLTSFVVQQSSPSDWGYSPPMFPARFYQQLSLLDVSIVRPSSPSNLHEAITKYGRLFHVDLHHYCAKGHVFLAQTLLSHFHHTNLRIRHDGTLGEWDDEDQCELWIKTGVTKNLKYDTKNLIMNEYAPGKFALEVRGTTAWLKVVNTNDHDKHLSLDTMVAMPECRYPAVEFSVSKDVTPIIVDCPKKSPYAWQVHVVRRISLGVFPPGESTITIRVLSGAPWPYFRIVGIGFGQFHNVGSSAHLSFY